MIFLVPGQFSLHSSGLSPGDSYPASPQPSTVLESRQCQCSVQQNRTGEGERIYSDYTHSYLVYMCETYGLDVSWKQDTAGLSASADYLLDLLSSPKKYLVCRRATQAAKLHSQFVEWLFQPFICSDQISTLISSTYSQWF